MSDAALLSRSRFTCAAISTDKAGGISQNCGWAVSTNPLSDSKAHNAPFPITPAAMPDTNDRRAKARNT